MRVEGKIAGIWNGGWQRTAWQMADGRGQMADHPACAVESSGSVSSILRICHPPCCHPPSRLATSNPVAARSSPVVGSLDLRDSGLTPPGLADKVPPLRALAVMVDAPRPSPRRASSGPIRRQLHRLGTRSASSQERIPDGDPRPISGHHPLDPHPCRRPGPRGSTPESPLAPSAGRRRPLDVPALAATGSPEALSRRRARSVGWDRPGTRPVKSIGAEILADGARTLAPHRRCRA